MSDLGQLLKDSSDEELCVEALGILANLNLPDIDFQRVVTQLDLLPYVMSKLKVCLCIFFSLALSPASGCNIEKLGGGGEGFGDEAIVVVW